MKHPISFLSAVLFAIHGVGISKAEPMPQDYWAHYGKKLASPNEELKTCITISDSAIYVASYDSGDSKIEKYGLDGSYDSTFTPDFTSIVGMDCDSDGNLYLYDHELRLLQSFDPSGTQRWSTGSTGAGDGQFGSFDRPLRSSSSLTIDDEGDVYVVDPGNDRIQVFNSQGVFLRSWEIGEPLSSSLNGRGYGVDVIDDQVVVVDGALGETRFQIFSRTGEFQKTDTSFSAARILLEGMPDGLMLINNTGGARSLLDLTLGIRPIEIEVGNIQVAASLDAAFTEIGDLWMCHGSDVLMHERRYSSTDNPSSPNALPLPKVSKVEQRPASTLLDIDFSILDSDSSTVEVAALAFVDGGESLEDVLRLATLVEGTDANVGPGQTPNVPRRLTWNAAADWTSEFGEVEIEILAKDERDLLGIHWITIPTDGVTPSFVASAKPIEDEELLSLWLWLIATDDPGVVLTNGEVKAVGGTHAGQVLASGVTTTSTGREFLHDLLGIRAITAEELTALEAGNYGLSGSSNLTVVKP
ncbi:hypothetical protein [Haloferula sp.]|uniref:hypothetical protein n=1 Tax=Haloferula sp. TaxID=2497595 RepID=UPI0032A0A168